MTGTEIPAIPARLTHRPSVGGVVHPWVNVRLADGGVDFRVAHRKKWLSAWRDRLCQVCGQALTPPVVLLCGPNQLARLLFDEPAVHPECGLYASRACPMVAGRRTAYAASVPVAQGRRGRACPEPGCDCAGWVPDDDKPHSYGAPAHDWYAVWARGYILAFDPSGDLDGGAVHPDDVLRVRIVSRGGEGRVYRSLTGVEVAALVTDPAVTA